MNDTGSLKYFTDIKYSTLMTEDILTLHKMIEQKKFDTKINLAAVKI